MIAQIKCNGVVNAAKPLDAIVPSGSVIERRPIKLNPNNVIVDKTNTIKADFLGIMRLNIKKNNPAKMPGIIEAKEIEPMLTTSGILNPVTDSWI